MDLELNRITEFDEKIREIARQFGLDFFPQEFDAIPRQLFTLVIRTGL